MHITLHPIRSDAALTLGRLGDTLIVNGEAFDFSDLPEGATLPAPAVKSPWFCGEVTRRDGCLCLRMLLPLPADAGDSARFPTTLHVAGDGPVALPNRAQRTKE